ncbi:MAG: biotin--[acetyl-CoA-carboxylase] ligase [Cyanobacteria bacterium]|nr:biotin--[acetyl-CoA-carboxylase] ligase [Cyanobacteriota bacterium]MDW8202515.1 biotin--[acetyl-CoA-carboxylase] ligase [Cyanobacteriota bacterium SKYGB_h_bin112]
MAQSGSGLSASIPSWLHWLEECASTNTWAIDHAAYLQHGDVVVTQRQTAGRGQQGRTWHSPPGVLTASVVLDHIRPHCLPSFSLAAGLAVIYAVEDLAPDVQGMLRLKWPNDLYVCDRKLAGILCESGWRQPAESRRTIVGIGLNRWVDFTQTGLTTAQLGHPISLHSLTAQVPTELAMLEQIRRYLLQAVGLLATTQASEPLKPLLPALQERDYLRHQNLSFTTAEGTIVGQGAGIDATGQLLIRLGDGTVRAFASGQARVQA